MSFVPSWLRGSRESLVSASYDEPVPPLHFNTEELAGHARACSRRAHVSDVPLDDGLLDRLRDNQQRLAQIGKRLDVAHRAGIRLSPGGVWFLDNQHLIAEQIRLAQRHLPRGYSRALPHLLDGPYVGYPRVYHLALEVIAHVDGRVDAVNLAGFVDAWQEVTPLKLGELWAIPIMLRLALIENLRRVADRLAIAMTHRLLAQEWAQTFVQAASKDSNAVLLVAADMARTEPPLSNAFVAELVQRLQDTRDMMEIPLSWVHRRLADAGSTVQGRVQAESCEQAANQVSLSSSIGSLRFLNAMVWRDFVEASSKVDDVLGMDPAGVYRAMDFATRDRYRHAVEDLARDARTDESAVASLAIQLSREGEPTADGDRRETHVGYYLVDRGRSALIALLPGMGWSRRLRRGMEAQTWGATYFVVLFGVTTLATIAVVSALTSSPTLAWGWWVLIAILAATATSQLGVLAANALTTSYRAPTVLPRMDFSDAIPESCRTLVIVPTLLSSLEGVATLLEGLEVRYLGNPEANLMFGLLTDFHDAETQCRVNDAEVLEAVVVGIATLNTRYKDPTRFHLLHRARDWNAQDHRWMGYERKRGKLEALNAFLRGHDRRPAALAPAFHTVAGDAEGLRNIAFVITLDTDTGLPRGAGHKLVGSMAHALNRPRHDEDSGRVCEGHGILQPRVAIHMPSTRRSWFVRLCGGGAGGIDPYTRAVSDVYQDLFGEGSFVGKGIYDIDAFTRATDNRLPDNLILSHDLIEGCFARSGLVSDVVLYEDQPSHILVESGRRRRWMRGDWQILAWLLPWVPHRDGRWGANVLTALSRWKIADNLRRSVVPIATVAGATAGLALLRDPLALILTVLGLVYLPALLASLSGFAHRPRGRNLRAHVVGESRLLGGRLVQATVGLAFLPEDAWNSLDAIARATTRMFVTHRRLLEWPGARLIAGLSAWQFLSAMSLGPILAVGILVGRAAQGWGLVGPALLLVVPWALSPWLAAWLSAFRDENPSPLPAHQQARLRRIARATWRYFETFVGPEDNWLPPDNMQEVPSTIVAHRTSPTNIGLGLLSDLAAHDFGYLSTAALIARTRQTIDSVVALEKHRGHLYNWYDTKTLQPLSPRYVSAVDSGNLLGHLMVFESGVRELEGTPLVSARALEGLVDTLDIVLDHDPQWSSTLAPLREALQHRPNTLGAAHRCARDVETAVAEVAEHLDAHLIDKGRSDASDWLQALLMQCESVLVAPTARFAQWLPRLASERRGEANTQGPWSLDAPVPTLGALVRMGAQLGAPLPEEAGWRSYARASGIEAQKLLAEASTLADLAASLNAMELGFLYDRQADLFAIGYNVDDSRRDTGHYDLLASEARLLSYLAVAMREVPEAHWFTLGRLVTEWKDEAALLSWNGSMFEYLMPLLVMPSVRGTLLDQTCRTAVRRQAAYGRERGIPWGVSESAYNLTDTHLNYQYKAFGVPGLGLTRGLSDDLVISPYATVMALMVDPRAAYANLERLASSGFEGRFGFYDAIDYTPRRQALGERHALIRSYMAHHQGMSLLAIAFTLLDQPMQRRFTARPALAATELLLHERIPALDGRLGLPHDGQVLAPIALQPPPELRVIPTPHTPTPETHWLSNGKYAVMVSNAGGGFSRWKNTTLTRWREDPTRDDWGSFLYVRDVEKNTLWSATHQPTRVEGERYEAIFPPSRAEFRRRDDGLDLHTCIAVSPEDDVEVRQYNLTNLGRRHRLVDLTTYAEVVLTAQGADQAHPAFSNLFVHTEILAERQAILCTRRPRSGHDDAPVLVHLVVTGTPKSEAFQFETDRRVYLGRGGTVRHPAGIMEGNEGSVLDPIVAIRCRLRLAPSQKTQIHVITGVAPTRDEALALIDKYRDVHAGDRVFELACTHRQVVLRQLGITEVEADTYLRMVSAILYADPERRASEAILSRNRRGQSGLWTFGISGDHPIVLVRIASVDAIALVREVVRAHAWWRGLGLLVDLVLLDETEAGYEDALRTRVLSVVSLSPGAPALDEPGGIFVRHVAQFAEEDRILLQTMARIVLSGRAGTLAEQIARPTRPRIESRTLLPKRSPATDPLLPSIAASLEPGFVEQGRAYRIVTTATRPTPAPWSNVLANPHFGTLVTESGSAYTWCENSHEFRLTPWENDPVSDRSGEAFYLRDEETGAFWSPTALPVPGTGVYETHHRFGRSTFTHIEREIQSEMTLLVAIDAPVKLITFTLRNLGMRKRSLSVTGYCEWALGEHRSTLTVTTDVDPNDGSILARNPYHPEFGARIAFFGVSSSRKSVSGDRTEFIGRNGDLSAPAAMQREELSGRVGAGLDACGAIMVPVSLDPGATIELVFVLGVGSSLHDVRTLQRRFKSPNAARHALAEVVAHWEDMLGVIQVRTPDPDLDVLLNGWLPYQVISSRLWARTGYYQSGGAFGFRDQLQDAMGLMALRPELLREQIIRSAGRQFRDGDVQHWWHPPSGRGVRTRCSDDFLWLPAAVARYVEGVGDVGVLDVRRHFLEGRQVAPNEEAYLDLPHRSESSATIYEHCVHAIEHGLRFGKHGLPLIGSGDWNDGMNQVGIQGRGESVWLGFFLYDVLTRFAPVALAMDDEAFAERCRSEAAGLRERVEASGWDGAWYGRAWFDDGTPLGVDGRAECRIDSLPQSWAVLSGLGDASRARIAMDALDTQLVDRELGIVKLLAPPFDTEHPNPGYIRSYPPGVRENGGQYTHAAVWAAMAFAQLGDWQRAWEITSMLQPTSHTKTSRARETYRVEPYVMSADVYGVGRHGGMGGWSWQTGAAAWMLRLGLESLLGWKLEVNRLSFAPCVPPTWNGFRVRYRFRRTPYQIHLRPAAPGEPGGSIVLDGAPIGTSYLTLVDDGEPHSVEFTYLRATDAQLPA